MKFSIHENASENIVREMAAILSRGDELIKNVHLIIKVLSVSMGIEF